MGDEIVLLTVLFDFFAWVIRKAVTGGDVDN